MTLLKAFVGAVLIGAIGIFALSLMSRDSADSAVAGHHFLVVKCMYESCIDGAKRPCG